MTVRNIAIGGMTGGSGHVGMVTQGYGGTFTAPPPGVIISLSLQERGVFMILLERGVSLELKERGITLEKVT